VAMCNVHMGERLEGLSGGRICLLPPTNLQEVSGHFAVAMRMKG
jgi:hypothetical protein